MANKKLLVTGVSGTGKSTICRALAVRGVQTIGIDETPGLSYWVNKETKEKLIKKADFTEAFLAEHEWVCDMELLQKLVETTEGTVVICGNVENIKECIDFCDKTLFLSCDAQTLFARIDARKDNDYGKSEDAKQFILGYMQELEDVCMQAGAIRINVQQPIDAVVAEVMTYTT